jgi:hypothetical protein
MLFKKLEFFCFKVMFWVFLVFLCKDVKNNFFLNLFFNTFLNKKNLKNNYHHNIKEKSIYYVSKVGGV